VTEADWNLSSDPRGMLEFLRGNVRGNERKLRLFSVAVVRRVWGFLTEARSMRAVDSVERLADGLASPEEHKAAADDAWDAVPQSYEAARAGWKIAPWYAARAASGVAFLHDAIWDTALYTAWSAAAAVATEGLDWEDGTWDRALRAAWVASGYDPLEGEDWDEVRSSDAVWEMGWDSFTSFPRWATERREQAALLRDVFGPLPFRQVRIDPSWRTPNVVALAATSYEERRFDDLPVLADALDEAGCDDPEILGHLRQPGPGHIRGCWALDLVLGKE
jgi:hypothetical protein